MSRGSCLFCCVFSGEGDTAHAVLSVLESTILGCDVHAHAHAPAQKSSTNFMMHPFVLRICSTNSLGHGHGHGYECHSQYKVTPEGGRGALLLYVY